MGFINHLITGGPHIVAFTTVRSWLDSSVKLQHGQHIATKNFRGSQVAIPTPISSCSYMWVSKLSLPNPPGFIIIFPSFSGAMLRYTS